MRSRSTLLVLATTLLLTTGCATTAPSNANSAGAARDQQSAPLGSRIKKRSAVAPVMGATREDIEQGRVQAGAVQTGQVQRNP